MELDISFKKNFFLSFQERACKFKSGRKRILLVIHGYPPRYNAGSENYTQNLAHGLFDAGINVAVFSRDENPFLPDYQLIYESDPLKPNIPVILINHPRSNIRIRNEHIDSAFKDTLKCFRPDIVHFSHLSHLSTGMVEQAKAYGAKTVFTLQDYWLMCPRGQFLEWGLTFEEPWRLCKGQENSKCAARCFNRYTTGMNPNESQGYWVNWVRERMEETRKTCDIVDLFIAPSHHLMERHIEEFGIPSEKIVYLDYGFNLERLKNRQRTPEEDFVFGYIGRHHPSKGLNHLIQAFFELEGKAKLSVWGKHDGHLTDSLKRMYEGRLSDGKRIEWLGGYPNQDITKEVFDKCDCIVVPSIWEENSPLVIHEAQQVKVPVITASFGGMGEYVKDGLNGLTYKHRDVDELRRTMERALQNPEKLELLGKRGYLFSDDGSVPSIDSHIRDLIALYQNLEVEKSVSKERVLCS